VVCEKTGERDYNKQIIKSFLKTELFSGGSIGRPWSSISIRPFRRKRNKGKASGLSLHIDSTTAE